MSPVVLEINIYICSTNNIASCPLVELGLESGKQNNHRHTALACGDQCKLTNKGEL